MNKVMVIGRLVKDPVVKYSQGDNAMAIAKYTLAVGRRYKKQGADQPADFINCTAFGNTAEFAHKYLQKGMKIAVVGRMHVDSYINNESQTVYTTEVVVEEHEFCESKKED